MGNVYGHAENVDHELGFKIKSSGFFEGSNFFCLGDYSRAKSGNII